MVAGVEVDAILAAVKLAIILGASVATINNRLLSAVATCNCFTLLIKMQFKLGIFLTPSDPVVARSFFYITQLLVAICLYHNS